MHVHLFKNSAPPNKVNKSGNLSKKVVFEGMNFTEKGALDILNPTILIRYGDSDNDIRDIEDIAVFNYMYIPKFNRYYYIDSISTEGALIRISGRCDVLHSHKKDILNSTQYVLRQETYNNSPYLDDNMLPISSKHNYVGKAFGRKVADVTCGRVILATTGNGGTIV
jgi:hypothetical protein